MTYGSNKKRFIEKSVKAVTHLTVFRHRPVLYVACVDVKYASSIIRKETAPKSSQVCVMACNHVCLQSN